jgi:hypothetical protein
MMPRLVLHVVARDSEEGRPGCRGTADSPAPIHYHLYALTSNGSLAKYHMLNSSEINSHQFNTAHLPTVDISTNV